MSKGLHFGASLTWNVLSIRELLVAVVNVDFCDEHHATYLVIEMTQMIPNWFITNYGLSNCEPF